MKKCSVCGKEKQLDSFHKDRSNSNGVYSCCKSCKQNKRKENYLKKYKNVKIIKKRCNKCGKNKDLEEYHKKKNGKYGVAAICKKCVSKWMKEYNSNPSVKDKIKQRDARRFLYNIDSLSEKEIRRRKNKAIALRNTYGITLEQYENMLVKQKYRCKICNFKASDRPYSSHSEKNKNTLHVDHDHESNKIRGLLCVNCNQGLGNFKDNTGLLKKAIEYLRR